MIDGPNGTPLPGLKTKKNVALAHLSMLSGLSIENRSIGYFLASFAGKHAPYNRGYPWRNPVSATMKHVREFLLDRKSGEDRLLTLESISFNWTEC